FVIAGCGAWALARELGLSRPAALWACWAFPLSGMLVSFLLFPLGNALALVPWVFWAVERLASGAGGGRSLALLAGVQLLGGHPETSAYTALLATIYLAVRSDWASGRGRVLTTWLRFAGGWALAAGIAAVQILPLALLLPATSKWAGAVASRGEIPLSLLLRQPLRLILPQMYGHPAAGTWWGPFNYSATAVYVCALGLVFAAAGLARVKGDRRIRAVAVVLAVSFLAAYHLARLSEVLHALPILGRAAPHRLIFGVELGLALLGAAGLDLWLAGKGRGILAGGAVVTFGAAVAWKLLGGEWGARGFACGQLRWTAWVVGLAVLAGLSLRLAPELRWRVLPVFLALLVLDLLIAQGRIIPGLSFSRFYPETGAVRFLQEQGGRVAALGEELRPNAAMVYGLRDLRGDDPVKLERFERAYGGLGRYDAVYLAPIERWGDPRLDSWGVRWVLAGPDEAAPVPGWRLAYAGADARVYERPGTLPLVRWADGGTDGIEVRKAEPGVWRIGWHLAGKHLAGNRRLVISETWEPGWRAEVAGRVISVVPVNDGTALGIDLPMGAVPGVSEVEVRYRAPGLATGAGVSAVAFLGAFGWRRRRV